ncbi:hypothetical protein BT96DRAFT_1004182, partial [Gymnopus androsaceus JB14]
MSGTYIELFNASSDDDLQYNDDGDGLGLEDQDPEDEEDNTEMPEDVEHSRPSCSNLRNGSPNSDPPLNFPNSPNSNCSASIHEKQQVVLAIVASSNSQDAMSEDQEMQQFEAAEGNTPVAQQDWDWGGNSGGSATEQSQPNEIHAESGRNSPVAVPVPPMR